MADPTSHSEQLTIGVVTPHTAPGPEVELPAFSRGRVATLIARTKTPPRASDRPPEFLASTVAGLRALSMPAVIDLVTATFRNRSIDVIAHASTTSSYVLGRRAETALIEHIARDCGVPVVASGAAAVAGLRACAVHRVQLIHPPWFDDAFDALGTTYFRDYGFDAWVSKAISLPSDPARVTTEQIVRWVVTHVADRAEAIFLAGTGFRTAEAIDELERYGTISRWSHPGPALGNNDRHEYRTDDQRLRPTASHRITRQPDHANPSRVQQAKHAFQPVRSDDRHLLNSSYS